MKTIEDEHNIRGNENNEHDSHMANSKSTSTKEHQNPYKRCFQYLEGYHEDDFVIIEGIQNVGNNEKYDINPSPRRLSRYEQILTQPIAATKPLNTT